MNEGNVRHINEARLNRRLGPAASDEAGERTGGDGTKGDPPDMSDIGNRFSKLEGSFDVLKILISVMIAITLRGFAFLGTQMIRLDNKIDATSQRLDASVARLNDKIDAIPQRLAEEFRAMRAEMSAQTSAIASSITAARQSAPQVLLVPAQPTQPAAQKP